MKNLKLALAVIVGSAILSGCALSQMIKAAQDSNLTVTPSPLEVHGGKIPHDLTATLPPKILPSGKIYTMYTIYQYGDQSVNVGSIVLNANDYPNSSTQSTPVNESFNFDYVEGMNPGSLVMVGEAKDPKNGKTKTTDTLALAQGLILTSTLVEDTYYSSYAAHGYVEREELIPTSVNFYFDQGRSNVNMGLNVDGDNNKNKNAMLSAFIAEKNVTRTVTITGTHSPEGTETINTGLAADRATAIEKIYRKQMRKYDYKGAADSIEFIQKPVVQDWASLKSALASFDEVSDDSKAKMNQIINGNGSFEDKEKALQGVDGYSKVFDDIYPSLRSAQTNILTVEEKKTPAEIAVLAKQVADGEASADTLKMDEMFFAASLTPSLEEKAAIYSAATKKGESWIAHNNLAATYLEMAIAGDDSKVEDALTQLEIASNLNGSASHITSNTGAAYVMQGEYEQAYGALSDASTNDNVVNARVNSMKGAIETRNGDYETAKASFGAASDDGRTNINKGLAYLLSGDNTQAQSAFEAAQGDEEMGAKAFYLSAVTAARNGSGPEVASNLVEAVKLDPDLKEAALNDAEFRDFANQVAQAVQ
ncbi:MAG: hypothetical protein GY816_23075 [Cytophagales bacterium]|nr:hypothetical protein [Cytophagales bacterium]